MKQKLLFFLNRRFELNALKAEVKKIGTNLITASIISIFINHITEFNSTFLIAAIWITIIGLIALALGVIKRG